MMTTIHSQVGTVILSLGACRLYGEPTRICNLRGLRREPVRKTDLAVWRAFSARPRPISLRKQLFR